MTDDAQILYGQALKRHRAKDYAGAVELLERAVELAPDHADSWEALGVLYDKVERLDDAVRATQRLLELAPEEIMGWTNLSRFLMKRGEIKPAEEAQAKARLLGWKADLASGGGGSSDFVQAGASAAPTASAPVSIAGLAQGGGAAPPDAGGPDQAASAPPSAADAQAAAEALARKIQRFEALAAAQPGDTLARQSLGKLYLQAERHEDAVRVLRELLELEPERSAAYPLLGAAFEGLGKRARAMSTYTEGIALAERRGDLHPRNQMQEALERLR